MSVNLKQNGDLIRISASSKIIPNPILDGNEDILSGLDINGTKFSIYDINSGIQYDELPEANVGFLNKIVQYTGETTDKYTNGCFYQCADVSGEETVAFEVGKPAITFSYIAPIDQTITVTGRYAWVRIYKDNGGLDTYWEEQGKHSFDVAKGQKFEIYPIVAGSTVSNTYTVTYYTADIYDWVYKDICIDNSDDTEEEDTKQDIIQYAVVPEANKESLNKIIQYIGETTDKYTNGLFYKCTDVSGEESHKLNAGDPASTFSYTVPTDQTITISGRYVWARVYKTDGTMINTWWEESGKYTYDLTAGQRFECYPIVAGSTCRYDLEIKYYTADIYDWVNIHVDNVDVDNIMDTITTMIEDNIGDITAIVENKQDIIPTYTSSEYEAIKDTIPTGTLFNISDDNPVNPIADISWKDITSECTWNTTTIRNDSGLNLVFENKALRMYMVQAYFNKTTGIGLDVVTLPNVAIASFKSGTTTYNSPSTSFAEISIDSGTNRVYVDISHAANNMPVQLFVIY